jgi:hypothetical protein
MPDAATVDTALFGDLDEVARDAGRALDRATQPSLYDRLDWLRLTREHVLPTAGLLAARARLGDHGAWLFLHDQGSGRACAFAGWYTLAVAPVFTPGSPPAVRLRLLRSLAYALRGLKRIDLAPLEDGAVSLLRGAFRPMGWWAAEREETANWTASVRDRTFDGYWAGRPSKLRNTVRRRLKGSDLTTRILDRYDDDAWAAYEEVYAGSWKPAEGSPAFLRALARIEGAAGSLRLGLAYRGDRPVAGQFWTVEGGVAVIHKLAYIETERASSPGTLLSHAMFRHVIERDRPAVIDYGNGDEPYKADWMTERRVLRRLSLFNTRKLGGLAEAAGARASAFARSVRGG